MHWRSVPHNSATKHEWQKMSKQKFWLCLLNELTKIVAASSRNIKGRHTQFGYECTFMTITLLSQGISSKNGPQSFRLEICVFFFFFHCCKMKKDKNDKMQSWMEEGQGKRKEGFHFVLLSKEENWLHHNTTKSIKNLPLCVSPLAFLSYTPQPPQETMMTFPYVSRLVWFLWKWYAEKKSC